MSPAIRLMRAPLLGAALLLTALVGTAVAAPLLQDLSDRTLKCSIEPPFYIAPKAESITTLRFADAEGAPWDDLTVPLTPPALQKAEAERVEILLPASAGHAKPTLVALVRTKEKDPDTGKMRTVISAHLDGDTVGDECAVEKGRAPYVTGRFNSLRETICGNDPTPKCISQLKSLCGPEPTFACATDARAKLIKTGKGK